VVFPGAVATNITMTGVGIGLLDGCRSAAHRTTGPAATTILDGMEKDAFH
jgi:hypothetical protein